MSCIRRLRDTLTCGCSIFDAEFLIGEGIARAKVAKAGKESGDV